jgi:hypothetical protein
MNTTLEASALDSVIERATPEQRKYLIERLLPRFLEETRYLPQPITNSAGEMVGYFVPRYRSTATTPPQWSPEQQAEFRRRIATPDDSVDAEEFIKLLGLEDARRSK